MANVFQMAITGLPNLAAIIKAYRSDPMLGGEWTLPYPNWNTKSSIASNVNAGALKGVTNAVLGESVVHGGIRIKAETYSESAGADVSSQLILAVEGKKAWITDNIALRPRVWTITGYVMAEWYEASTIFGFTILKKKKKILELRNKRTALLFKTVDNEVVPVAIVDVSFNPTGDVSNGLPLTIQLQEVPILTTEELTETPDIAGSAPEVGTSIGKAVGVGSGSVATSVPITNGDSLDAAIKASIK